MANRATPPISFEVYPPRTAASFARLRQTLTELASVTPGFVSVTYGASGSAQEATREVVVDILKEGKHVPLVHLTCIGKTEAQLVAVIREFLACGARRFLALRGDPPAGDPTWTPEPGGLTTAAQLVELIRRTAREFFAESQNLPDDGASQPQITIAVAAFLNGNAGIGSTADEDITKLLEKQAAGADFAITQLFYRAREYFDFVAAARARGVTLPIVPGVLPPTDPGRLDRVAELSGVPAPADLLAELYAAVSEDATETQLRQHSLGVSFTVNLINQLLTGGAPAIHLYTFNQHRAVLDVLCALRLIDFSQPPAPAIH